MFDSIRVALIALAAGAATSTAPQVTSAGIDGPLEATLPSPSLPPKTASADSPPADSPSVDDAADAEIVAPEPAARSLSELVGRHAQAGAASDEQDCLAAAVYFEAKGEPLEGQLAVARTIMNRTTSGRFARSLCGVIRQPGQFSFMHHSTAFPQVNREAKTWRTALTIARIAMDDLWAGPVRDALYFHAKRVAPGWRMVRLASVGNQVFYR